MYTLYSFGTPNGIKPTIMLHELSQSYVIKTIDISKGEQFNPEFLKISPNNKIPVLYDSQTDFYLFESVAILQYLAEKHHQFLPDSLHNKYAVIEWCLFQAAHIGPMFGQLGHFHRMDEKIPYALKRYADESERLLGVMEKQLTQFSYIAGKEYTIADMAIWPWIYCFQVFYQQTIDVQRFAHLLKWYQRISERTAVKAALAAYDLTLEGRKK
ncbi:glutathione S-transferase N-terminal domain-containing protein [Legionella sp. PATHC035]|uniref:glutathione S-transferase family protein n=1 Tax=Legionella sp. PATHC035 TaxID=2992040 RepID=UPI002244C9A3|nr:glutathione S-transferase N-terminal domain-containing protein [Legionella sp. PATHC035]MCW8409029.1 glutathione S-transferase N-terminal domain-containing protein [Legionella sp. PATHC035]